MSRFLLCEDDGVWLRGPPQQQRHGLCRRRAIRTEASRVRLGCGGAAEAPDTLPQPPSPLPSKTRSHHHPITSAPSTSVVPAVWSAVAFKLSHCPISLSREVIRAIDFKNADICGCIHVHRSEHAHFSLRAINLDREVGSETLLLHRAAQRPMHNVSGLVRGVRQSEDDIFSAAVRTSNKHYSSGRLLAFYFPETSLPLLGLPFFR